MQQISSANQDIQQDAPIESDRMPIANHEKPQNEYNAQILTKPTDIIICKLNNYKECYKIDGNSKFFCTK